jgi:alpha-N-acetylglucosaminidase
MKTLLLVLLLAVPFASAGPVEAARDLIQRVVPQHANEFVVELIPPADGMDVFEIESLDGKVVLRGDNGVSIASALNHYLKAIAHCQLTWCGDQLSLPPAPPAVPAKIRTVCPTDTGLCSITAPSAIRAHGGTGRAGNANSTSWR